MKNEVVRLTLEGEGYIAFNNLVSRVDFGEKLNPRKEKESVLRLGLDVLQKLVGNINRRSGSAFVGANVDEIIKQGSRPDIDYESLYFKLSAAVSKAAKAYDKDTEVMPAKAWAGIEEIVGVPETE